LSPGIDPIAVRSWSSVGFVSNFSTSAVPPVKSMPRGSPRVIITATPPSMISTERAIACQRQRMKL
jgi:hypothetical protein